MTQLKNQKFIKIINLDNAIEAQLIQSILDQHQLPYRIRSFYDTAYDGLFQVQKGWGELTAPEPYREEILDIVKEIRSNQEELSDWHPESSKSRHWSPLETPLWMIRF